MSIPHMAAQCDILLYFVKLRAADQSQRIFLSVNYMGLQCGVKFTEVDGGWCCTKRFEHGHPQLVAGYADFKTLQVIW